MSKITQAQIAHQLGVSRVTVSKVLLDKPGVSQETRERVFELLRSYGESAESIVQRRRTRSHGGTQEPAPRNVAVVFPGNLAEKDFWSPIIQGISNILYRMNIHMRLLLTSADNHTPPPEFISDPPDAVINVYTFEDDYYRFLAERGIPFVSYDTAVGLNYHPICDVVCTDNEIATHLLTQHLIAKGHKKIAFVGDHASINSFYLRWKGYRDAMLDSELPLLYDELFYYPDIRSQYDINHLYSCLEKCGDPPTAYVCANDSIAYSMNYIQRQHEDRLGRFDLTGFDNEPQFISALPNVSTASFSKEEIATCLVEQVLWRYENPDRPHRIITIPSQIILR